MATANSTMPPNSRLSCSEGSTASRAAAGTVPAVRPMTAQRRPPRSMARRSRNVRSVVNTMVDARIGPGTSRVSIRMSIGEPRIPMPNPTAPCRVNPTAPHNMTRRVSNGDMVGRDGPVA